MTPDDEAEFIALWQQGLETAVIADAQHLGIPRGTVQARAHRLQQRGLIQPRPKGGPIRVSGPTPGSPTPGQRPGQSIDTDVVVIIKL
jgi:hypothetical protein